MNVHRFATGSVTAITTNHKLVNPYDATLRFNKIVEQKDDDLSSIIYSIDAAALLKILENDQLEDLFKLTFAGRPARNGVGLWDTLFNSANKEAITACFFTLQGDLTPIPRNRIAYTSNFLNFSMPTSRVYLNHVIPGDKLGIAINDLSKNKTYVLLYVIDDTCSCISTVKDSEGRSSLIPSVNVSLLHALCIERDGTAAVVDSDENNLYDPIVLTPLVEWLNDAVYDITVAYPWKPHFIPAHGPRQNQAKFEKKVSKEIETAELISYAEFELLCRKHYNNASFSQRRAKGMRLRPNARTTVVPSLPMVEVKTIGERFIVTFDDTNNPEGKSYAFQISDLGKNAAIEVYLTNKDLENNSNDEFSKVVPLSAEKFGENSFARYFSVNF